MAITPEPRYTVQHLLNISSPYSYDTPNFALINEGVTELTEEFNPETETTQYIAEKDAVTYVKRYAPSITLSSYLVQDDSVNKRIREVINTLPVDSSADTDYIRFSYLDSIGDTSGKIIKYTAYRRRGTISAGNIGGSAGDTTSASITINGKGDVIKGVLTVDSSGGTATYSFVADTDISATVTFTATGSVEGATLTYGNTTKPIDASNHTAIFTVPKGFTALYEAISGSQKAYGRATATEDTNEVTVTLT